MIIFCPGLTPHLYCAGFYDYLPEDHALSFGPSLNKSQCKNIEILQDDFKEDFEFVRVSLRNSQGVVLNIPQPQVLVIIQDSTRPTGRHGSFVDKSVDF